MSEHLNELDRIDLKILGCLQQDGRISNLKLAEAVSLSPTAVLARVQRLTKDGYERYWGLLTQDAIVYFESKGADAKWVFKLKSLEDKSLFDPAGRLTDEGARIHRRAVLNLEVFWKAPDGKVYGTRRPPTKMP